MTHLDVKTGSSPVRQRTLLLNPLVDALDDHRPSELLDDALVISLLTVRICHRFGRAPLV